MKTIIIAALALTLSGCAGAVPWNIQNNAGINTLEAEFVVAEGMSGPTSIRVVGGKEQDNISFSGSLPDGTQFEYAATGVRSFDAVRARAAVEQAISSDVKEAAPGIVDAVVNALAAGL